MAKIISLISICLILSVSPLIAEEQVKDEQAKKPEFSQQGLLAGTAQGGYGSTSLGGWGGGPTGGPRAPLGGSVSKSGNSWVVSVSNNSEETYRANFAAIQYDKTGRKIKSNPFSLTIKGGEKAQRQFKAFPSAQNCNLEVRNWKKVG